MGGDVPICSVRDNIVIPCDHIKVLGIILDNSWKFDLHISDMCKNASRQKNALKRIFKFIRQDSHYKYRDRLEQLLSIFLDLLWQKTFRGLRSSRARLSFRILWPNASYVRISQKATISCRLQPIELDDWRQRFTSVSMDFNLWYPNDPFYEPSANNNFRVKHLLD